MKHYALLLLVAVTMWGCGDDYDDTQLQNDMNDIKSRVEKLESWCSTANTQISALQGLVSALEKQDYITGVTPIMEGNEETGYTITFAKGNAITIMNGKDGADGITPMIGAEQDTDGIYYWTIQAGDAEKTWLTDADGNKIRATGEQGEKGHVPALSVEKFNNKLYWKVDGEWLLNEGEKVPATGDKGDKGDTGATGSSGSSSNCIFSKVDYQTDLSNVTFTLKDGTTFIVPQTNAVTISMDSYEMIYCTAATDITLIFPTTMKAEDYTSIMATITDKNGTSMDIQTRATGNDTWTVSVTKPSFGNDGKIVLGSAKVTITPPTKLNSLAAILRVTVISKDGKEESISRPIMQVVPNNTAGNLSSASELTDNTGITQLAIKGSVNADDFSFIRTSLTSLEVLDLTLTDITEIPDRALRFGDSPNTTIKEIKLPETVKSIGYAAFSSCTALTKIDTKKVETINEWAFEKCSSLKTVILNDGLKKIHASAFYNCKALTSIEIPGSVEEIGENTVNPDQYSGCVFEGCDNLTTITLKEGIKKLHPNALGWCKGLTSIVMPSSITEIPNWTFNQCPNLKSVTLHNNITTIGEGAFSNCSSLEYITIPTNVTAINTATFQYSGLKSITLHNNITKIGDGAFEGCTALTLSSLPSTLQTIGSSAFNKCSSIESITIPNGVTELSDNAFANCSKLKSIQLPANLTKIGEFALTETDIETISLPASLTVIDKNAFHNCNKLVNVDCYASTAPTLTKDAETDNNPFFNDSEIDNNGRTLNILSTLDASAYSSWSPYFKEVKNTLNAN